MAGFLNSFIRHADVVKIANLAQVVNVIAPLLTRGDDLLHQSIYYPILLYASRRAGIALNPMVQGPGYESPVYGFAHHIDASAILGDGVLHLFLINRSQVEPAVVETSLSGLCLESVLSAELVSGPTVDATNTFEQPDAITYRSFEDVSIQDGNAAVKMPPLSAAGITFKLD